MFVIGTNDNDLFQIEIKFDRNSGDPRRIFRSMIDMIDAFEIAGKEFVSSVDPSLKAELSIVQTEDKSLLGKFSWKIFSSKKKKLPEESKKALEDGLSRTKKRLAMARSNVSTPSETETTQLADDLRTIAKETRKAYYEPQGEAPLDLPPQAFPEKQVRRMVMKLGTGTSMLRDRPEDGAVIIVAGESIPLSKDEIKEVKFDLVSPITELRRLDSGVVGPIKVHLRRVDYDDAAKWMVTYQDRHLGARILDKEWFEIIQEQRDMVGPKDSLLVHVRFLMNEKVDGKFSSHCEINKVDHIEKFTPPSPDSLLDVESEPE